jgi:uncharacterized protein (UPF0332 family)
MSTESQAHLIQYRLEQAHEALRDAEILFDANSLRGAINRAYYSMFYAVLALLATQQMGTSKHSGVIALFDREFVKPGLLSVDLSKALHLAFDQRQVHDYGELLQLDEDTARQTLDDAVHFINEIEAHVKQFLDPDTP